MTSAEKATETKLQSCAETGQSIVTWENKNGDRPIRKAYSASSLESRILQIV